MKLLLPTQPVQVIDDTTRYYDDNVLITSTDAAVAWEIPLVPYQHQPSQRRLDMVWGATLALAQLSGDLHIKMVRERATVAAWGAEQDRRAHATGHPSPHWPEHLVLGQRRQRQTATSRKHVYAISTLGRRNIFQQARSNLGKGIRATAPVSSDEIVRRGITAVNLRNLMARTALHAQPVTGAHLRAIRRRALWRGIDSPPSSATGRSSFDAAEIQGEFSDLELIPRLGCVQVNSPAGTVYTGTCVLSMFPSTMLFPRVGPWLAHLDKLVPEFDTEADLRFTLIPPAKAKADIKRAMDFAKDQERDARQAGADLPIDVEEVVTLGRELQYQIPRRRIPLVYGWARVRVDGSSPEEVEYRIERVTQHYANFGRVGIDVAYPRGRAQLDLLVEGVPGLGQVTHRSWRQRMMLETVAGALPQAGSEIGRPSDPYIGRTSGAFPSQAVRWSPHWAITEKRLNKPGGTLFRGNQGSGKSSALGSVIADETLAGRPVVCIDPSGKLAQALKSVSYLKDRIGILDLASTGSGMVDPFSPLLIPTPQRLAYEPGTKGDAQYETALADVLLERERLARETFHYLGWQHYAQMPDARTAVSKAVTAVAMGEEGEPALRKVIDRLLRGGAAAQYIGEHFDTATRSRAALMAFGARTDDDSDMGNVTTVFLTMAGISTPKVGKPMAEWLDREQLGAAMMNLAVEKGKHLLWKSPGLGTLVVDELHVPLSTDAGLSLVYETIAEGRKRGKAFLGALHNVAMAANERITAGISSTFQFRTTSVPELDNVVASLMLEDGPEIRRAIPNYANGECLAEMPDGHRDTMIWDLYEPELAMALGTTPDGGDADSAAEWSILEELPAVDPELIEVA